MAGLIVPLFAESGMWTVTIAGVVYRPALVDSSGRLQVDVISSPAPAGAATEATLLNVIRAFEEGAADYRTANENYSAVQVANELIAAPGAGNTIYVLGIQFSTEVAGLMRLTQSSGSPADVWGPHYFPANGGISLPPVRPVAVLNANSALRVTTTPAGNHTITVQALVL